MANLWERFEGIADAKEVESEKVNFKPLLPGEYDAVLDKIEAGESKTGLPMLKAQFSCIEGGRKLYANIMMQANNPDFTAKNIAKALVFVSAVAKEEVTFTGMGALAEKIASIPTGDVYRVKVEFDETRDYEHKYPILSIISENLDETPF